MAGAIDAVSTRASPQAATPLVFEAEVALVAAPVFVTDKAGKAVRGLTAEDFEVEDGGKRVPIDAFQAVDVDEPGGSMATAPSALPAAVLAAAARQFVFLFDLPFAPPVGITRARAAARRFVRESLAPDALVAAAIWQRWVPGSGATG
jgi:VWFA-related protein